MPWKLSIRFSKCNNSLRLIIIVSAAQRILVFKLLCLSSDQRRLHTGIEKYRHVPDLPSLLSRLNCCQCNDFYSTLFASSTAYMYSTSKYNRTKWKLLIHSRIRTYICIVRMCSCKYKRTGIIKEDINVNKKPYIQSYIGPFHACHHLPTELDQLFTRNAEHKRFSVMTINNLARKNKKKRHS